MDLCQSPCTAFSHLLVSGVSERSSALKNLTTFLLYMSSFQQPSSKLRLSFQAANNVKQTIRVGIKTVSTTKLLLMITVSFKSISYLVIDLVCIFNSFTLVQGNACWQDRVSLYCLQIQSFKRPHVTAHQCFELHNYLRVNFTRALPVD